MRNTRQCSATAAALSPAAARVVVRVVAFVMTLPPRHGPQELAKNFVFRAHVKNNIGNVLRELGLFREAHQYLEQARRLFMRVRDKVRPHKLMTLALRSLSRKENTHKPK
jgi:hypothetical protein